MEACIKKESERGIKRIVSPDGQYAKTYCFPVETKNGLTLVKVVPETGRTHQIRLQTSSRGFPVLGDSQYGSNVPFGEQFEDERLRAIALHSRSIRLRHPMREERIFIEAPLPGNWKEFLGEDPEGQIS